jgi:hypothetical protein
MHVRVLLFAAFALGTCSAAHAIGEQILSDSMEGGLDCTAIAPSTVVVNVRSSVLRPVFRHNGAPFPADPAHSARFFLVPREGSAILLGSSADTAPPIRVLDGVYDVEYRWFAGTEVPRNFDARVMQGVLVAGDRELRIDVPSTTLGGALTMNGAPFPPTGPGAATLSLTSYYGLGNLALANTNATQYTVRLIPGAYRLRYAAPGTTGAIPGNRSALRERVDIEIDTLVRDFDIPAAISQFQFRVDGQLAPGSLLENGLVSLRTADGDRVDLGESRTQVRTIRLIPRIYEAWWEGLIGSEVVPANPDSRFDRLVDASAAIVVLDVPTRRFEGDFRVNGAAPPANPLERGNIWMRDPLSGADVFLGSTDTGRFSRRLIPGAYDLVYGQIVGSEVVPANPQVVFERNRVVAASPAADIDVPVGRLGWNLTLNGAPFPASVLENGRINARSADDLAGILFGDTRTLGAQGNSRRLVPGAYRPTYTRLVGSELVPANSLASIDGSFGVLPGGDQEQTLDLRVGSWDFRFRDNGSLFPADPARRASFALRHRDDSVSLGTSDAPAGPRRLIANVWPLADGRTATVYYSWLAGSPVELPRNIDQPVSCHVLAE